MANSYWLAIGQSEVSYEYEGTAATGGRAADPLLLLQHAADH
jgi:hypothetical protein